MRAIIVVVADILTHEAFQMPFIRNDHMVEQVSTAVPTQRSFTEPLDVLQAALLAPKSRETEATTPGS